MGRFINIKNVKPVSYTCRKEFELIKGETYYVCFGNNNVYPCVFKEYVNDKLMIIVMVGDKEYTLYSDEIGRTPEEAVLNTVTN